MKKKIIVGVLVVFVIMCFTACSLHNDNIPEENTVTTENVEKENVATNEPEEVLVEESPAETKLDDELMEETTEAIENIYNYKFELSEEATPYMESSLFQALQWQEQMSNVNFDYGYTVRCEAIETLERYFNGGEIGNGNEKFWNTVDYVFGKGTSSAILEKEGEEYSVAIDDLCKRFATIRLWFVDLDEDGYRSWDAIEEFVSFVAQDESTQEYLNSIGGYWVYKDGYLDFSYDDKYTEGLAETIGIPTEALIDISSRMAYFFDMNF